MKEVKELIENQWSKNCWVGLDEALKVIDKQLKKYGDNSKEIAINDYISYCTSLSESKAMLLMACGAIKENMWACIEEEIMRCDDFIRQLDEVQGRNSDEEFQRANDVLEFINYLLSDEEKYNIDREKSNWQKNHSVESISSLWTFAMDYLHIYKVIQKNILLMPRHHMLNFRMIEPVFESHWDEVMDYSDLKGKRYYINISTMEVMEVIE